MFCMLLQRFAKVPELRKVLLSRDLRPLEQKLESAYGTGGSHLLMRYRDAQKTTNNKIKAFLRAFDECALAMVQTSIICGFAMTPYLFASLIYLQRFGMVIPLLMVEALLGDLNFLPAIIVSPLGKVFHLHLKAK